MNADQVHHDQRPGKALAGLASRALVGLDELWPRELIPVERRRTSSPFRGSPKTPLRWDDSPRRPRLAFGPWGCRPHRSALSGCCASAWAPSSSSHPDVLLGHQLGHPVAQPDRPGPDPDPSPRDDARRRRPDRDPGHRPGNDLGTPQPAPGGVHGALRGLLQWLARRLRGGLRRARCRGRLPPRRLLARPLRDRRHDLGAVPRHDPGGHGHGRPGRRLPAGLRSPPGDPTGLPGWATWERWRRSRPRSTSSSSSRSTRSNRRR